MQTKVQANPLLNRPTTELPFSPVQMVAADAPLTVPMFLQLSDMALDGTVIILFTKAKGLSMVFRNDPLSKVLVTSTFDGIPVIRDFLQAQIEKKLRQLICDELPAMIQQLSLAWADRVPSPKVRATTLNFTVPPIDTEEGYSHHPASRPRSMVSSTYNSSRSIPHLYRNQSFTGRGQLTPFTPAIAQAIYTSHSLSALDLAERKAKLKATVTTTQTQSTSDRQRPKKHSVIRLSKAAATPASQTPKGVQTPIQSSFTPVTVASYFDKDSPQSIAAVQISRKLQAIQEHEDVKKRDDTTEAERLIQQKRMEQQLKQKISQERRQAGLESGMHRVSLR
jgi:distribution and morphology protein 34